VTMKTLTAIMMMIIMIIIYLVLATMLEL
jgi:hypothetical protein